VRHPRSVSLSEMLSYLIWAEKVYLVSRISSPWNINRVNRMMLSPKQTEKVVLVRVEWKWPLGSRPGLVFPIAGWGSSTSSSPPSPVSTVSFFATFSKSW